MERKLAAILSADVQGYSRLMGDDEEATIRTLTAYRTIMTRLIQQHRGRVVDSPGDNLLAEFASAVDAVQGAVSIQQELTTRNAELPARRRMQYRIGINVGDVVVKDKRLYGDGVNIAARMESLADGGGISISEAVHMQVENKLDLIFSPQGEQTVKNIAKPIRVYKVERETEPPTPMPDLASLTALSLPDKPSIAVLPFTNMSTDPEQEYFGDGITDDIITDLSKLSDLFVIARNSTFTYKGRAVKVADVGRELGVQHVLEGRVRKAGNRIRINVQLLDACSGGHVWAERYDCELTNIFDLQDEIAQKIVFALKVTLTPEEQARFRQAPTTNFDAYDCYLRGLDCFHLYSPLGMSQARHLFERALTLDPQYAGAYASLGLVCAMEWSFQWHLDGVATLSQAATYVQKAVTLDPGLPLAHRILGMIFLWQKRYDQAVEESQRALALDPNSADGYAYLGFLFSFMGRSVEGLKAVQTAMRLNPYDPASYEIPLAASYYFAQRHEEAVQTLQQTISRAPDLLSAHLFLASLYSEAGKEAKARAEVDEIIRIHPRFSVDAFGKMFPIKNPEVRERFLTYLRKAGLK